MKILTLILVLINGVVLLFSIFYAMRFWISAVKNMFAISKYYKPDINPWGWRTGFNPFNGLFLIDTLTEEGKARAMEFWKAFGKFFLTILIPFALAYITEVITGVELISK